MYIRPIVHAFEKKTNVLISKSSLKFTDTVATYCLVALVTILMKHHMNPDFLVRRNLRVKLFTLKNGPKNMTKKLLARK